MVLKPLHDLWGQAYVGLGFLVEPDRSMTSSNRNMLPPKSSNPRNIVSLTLSRAKMLNCEGLRVAENLVGIRLRLVEKSRLW